MRKIIFVFIWVSCFQWTYSQRSSQYISQDRLFYEGLSMFQDQNYAGCIDKITEYKKQAKDRSLMAEADYLLVSADYYQGKENVAYELREYIDTYPETSHRNTICFMLGSVYFKENDYTMTNYWFEQTNIDYLSLSQQDDYAYRKGIIYIQTNEDAEALRLFTLLNRNSKTYRRASDFYLAYLSYKKGAYDEALAQFSQLKNSVEFQPDILYYITQIHFIQKKYAQTIQDGRNLLQQFPHNAYNPEINRITGISYYYESNYPLAVQYLTSFMESEEEVSAKDYYLLGLSHYNLQNYPQAITYLSKSNPDRTVFGQSTYLYLGQAYLKTKDYNNALMAFESASEMDADAAAKEAAMYNYAMLLHQNSVSAFGESVTVLENFVNSYPQSIYADRVNDALVDVYLTTQNYDTALNSIAKIKNPGRKILEAKQKIYYYLGTVEFTNNNYRQAVDYFTHSIDAGNYARREKEQAVYWRGESYYRQQQYAVAAKDYLAFIQTGNSTGGLLNRSYYNLGYCSFKEVNYPSAEHYFQLFIQKEKNDKNTLADAYARLGDCYFNNRRFTEAELAYNQAVLLVPSMSDYALFQKGYVMGLQKDYKGKIMQMDKLIREYPGSPYVSDAMYEKGRAYVLSGDSEAAIETYRHLLTNYPNSNWARKAGLEIGLLYFNNNRQEQSIAAYKKVIADYSGSPEAKVAIQDLKSVYFEMNNISAYANYVNSLGGAIKFETNEQDSLTYLAAERFLLKGEIPPAQQALNNYLQLFPNGSFKTNAHYYLANIYYDQKNFAVAKKEYAYVLEAGNTQFTEEAVGRTAELQYNSREYEEALQSYERLQTIAGSKTNKDAGSLGVIRSASHLNKPNSIIQAANALLKDETIGPEITSEALYYRAKAYNTIGEKSLAKDDWTVLSKDTRIAFGAEAKYLLADYYFNNANAPEAKSIVQDYIKEGTPHAYWLAKSFILLSDIFAKEGDTLQARQYLESLQSNYKNTNDDIHRTIEERLSKLN